MDKTIVIAEIGVNHNGSLKIAKEMVRVAKECGADIVKFQTFNVDAITSKHAEMAQYQKENIGEVKSQREMLYSLKLSNNNFLELSKYCKEVGIGFLSAPFDVESVRFLDELQDMWKIPSGEITNYPYLVEIARTGKKIILSTGMCTIEEIDECIKLLKESGAGEIMILQCNTQYPTEYEDANVKAMVTMKERYGCKVGYSDHTRGIIVPIMAVSLGASIIEKHFTLDKKMKGPDHKASLEPEELKEMVDAIRKTEKALGLGIKIPSVSENKNKIIARKSIVAACDIKKGEIFTEKNITTKRPGSGISAMKWNSVIGTKAVRDFSEDELIEI